MKAKHTKVRKSSPKPYTKKRLSDFGAVYLKVLELRDELNNSHLKQYLPMEYYEMKDAVVKWIGSFNDN
jgi:hypothetical protein